MIVMRVVFAGGGTLIFGLVLWAIRTGWYPSHGERISRTANPIAFWAVMATGAVMGLLFVSFGLFVH